jgi:predicted Zn-dependent protease
MKKNIQNMPLSTMSRRQFLFLSSMTAAGWVVGCAVNPVTGKQQLMLVSQKQEIDLDRQNSPYQFSADYGAVQDARLNAYIDQTGRRLAALSHRPDMPYSFRAVNANYINAYAFPGGSIAVTRGILLKLENEAELAALLGHELGHVNARHTAEIMSRGMLTNALIGVGAAILESRTGYGDLAAQLGMIGSGALLASYSRDNERQADSLGMEYMVQAGYGPDGMVGLMEVLNDLSKGRHGMTELLFSTHPMSSERYQFAKDAASGTYQTQKKQPLHRERYMDQIAGLRRIQGAVEAIQKGEEALGQKKFQAAEEQFKSALKQAPNDYSGLVLMAMCQLMQDKADAAAPYLERARQAYPQEAQAGYLSGLVNLKQKKYQAALSQFDAYDKLLPGNPNTIFYKGRCYEGMGKREQAGEHYYQYLQSVNSGENAQYAYNRLVEWGYVPSQPRK